MKILQAMMRNMPLSIYKLRLDWPKRRKKNGSTKEQNKKTRQQIRVRSLNLRNRKFQARNKKIVNLKTRKSIQVQRKMKRKEA